jgi:hypothetical protein
MILLDNTKSRGDSARRRVRRPSPFTALFALAASSAAAAALGCAEAPTGDLELRIYGEAFIEEGIPADIFVDGWAVSFSSFVVDVRGLAAADRAIDEAFVVDLAKPGGARYAEGGFELTTLTGVEAGAIGPVEWALAHDHAHDGINLNADDADTELMHYDAADILVSGIATQGTGASAAEIAFTWTFASATHYHPCEATGEVPEGGVGVAQLTVHGDHLFFDDLTSDDPNVAFDLIASADTDGDGEVTREELEAVDITGLDRYQTGGQDITDLWGFMAAQAKQVGHIDGEGHCETEPYDATHAH